jgi:hypothetical protein
MRKIIYISVLLLGFLSAAQAQKKIIYEDSTLLQKDEPVIQAPVEDLTVQDSVVVQAPAEALEEEPVDTSLSKNDLFLAYDSIKKWRNLKEYAYTQYLDSLLKNKKEPEIKNAPRSTAPGLFSSILNSGFVSVLLWTLAILFVLFIVYRLFLAEGVFLRKSKTAKNEAAVEEEIITHETDFETLIRQALQNLNFRQAVRYQYLRTLHVLAGKNMLELAPDKTNFQYVREIRDPVHQQAFAALTLHYEYVWYGGFEIDRNTYEKIESGFFGLNQKL